MLKALLREPRAKHCCVLEAMFPAGWTIDDLLTPYVPPDKVTGSTLLQELLRRRYIHNYRDFGLTG